MKLLRKRCYLERLESRVLFAGSPLVLSGGSGNNIYYLRKDASAAQLDVWINAASPGTGTPSQTHLMSAITTVTINGDGVNDSLTVDFSNGNPFPSTVSYIGGSGSTNTMTVTGLGGTAVTINGSTVTIGSTPINYSDTQFITINGSSSNDVLTQSAQPNASVTFNGGGGNDTLNINGGAYLLSGDPAATTTNLTVNDNSALFFASASAGTGINARHLAALNLGAGATAAVNSPVSSGDRAALVLGSLSINSTAQLDLGGNDLIVHNGDLATISGWLASGFSDGQWNGDGLASSAAHLDSRHLTALGTLANNNGGAPIDATFDGQSAVASDVLVKYTFYGDANLSGTVDSSDYSLVDNGFNSRSSGWFNGGFTYSGVTNGDDYLLLDNAFNSSNIPVDPLNTKLENALNVAELQMQKTVAAVGTSSNYPQYTNANGTWSWVPATQWTAGFFPGSLWQLYAVTGNPYYKTEATQFTNPLSVDDADTSDVGFQVYDSFDPLLLQNPANSSSIIQTMLTAAASKATQYNSTVGAFEAWRASTSGNPLANFNVLMDLIMDSNLLYWAAKQSGNQTYFNEAVSNATIEENYLVRADGGSAQFAYFNSANGQFIDNETYEGYSATSTWSRGEAWGIYGFTMNYQQTGRADFLATAKKMANYYIANLPSDFVPYWDFNSPAIPNTYRDTSSAAVAASGLLQLSKVLATTDPTDSAKYRTAAGDILNSLASPTYLANPANPGGGVLLQGALNVPANPSINNNSIIFGDYYFLEAVNEYLAG